MRNSTTDRLGAEITNQWRAFKGTKAEFMAQLEGVTLDQQVITYVNPLMKHIKQQFMPWAAGMEISFYCTIVRGRSLISVYSYGDSDWHCKY